MFEEGTIFNELLLERLNYFIYVVLLLIGLYAMISKNNLIKKLIGMSIFQTAIILFYVSLGVKEGATVPIYKAEHDPHGHAVSHDANDTEVDAGVVHSPQALEQGQGYANPLPHVLMLTAIVVGVATLGLALALCQRIFQGYGTVEEDELIVKLEREDARKSVSPLKAKVSTPKKTKTTKAKGSTSPKKSDKPKPKASKTTSKRTSSPKKKS